LDSKNLTHFLPSVACILKTKPVTSCFFFLKTFLLATEGETGKNFQVEGIPLHNFCGSVFEILVSSIRNFLCAFYAQIKIWTLQDRPLRMRDGGPLFSRPRAATFVLSFANFKSRAVSRDTSGDRVIPRADARVRAQASHRNITVLSHLLN